DQNNLYHLAYHDLLTGLKNENYFFENIKSRIQDISGEEKLAVIYLKLTNLDVLTNIIGYRNSNDLIMKIAEYIKTSFLNIGPVSLYRGNEFLISFLFKNNDKNYSYLKERIKEFLKEFKNFISKSGYDYLLKINIGVSVYPDQAEDAEDLLSKAHHAMILNDFRKNDYKIYNQDLFIEKLDYESLKKDLDKAIEREEFFLEFQLKVDTFTEEIIAAEALLRWKHPQKGLISPDIFIPIAEQNGFIKKIGVWVLKEAFEMLKKNIEKGCRCPKVCINISSIELNDPDVIDKIVETANSYSISNNLIEFEITERTFDKVSIDILYKLKDLGFLIVLDDFGTGYSSLSYFGKLPIDILKLDKSFIDEIKHWKTRTIVETIITLSHKFGVEVVGEGVETKEQLEILRDQGCDYIQGYYFYKPMPAEELDFYNT
ncbi:MAG: putative bifunctional diguanylate cyclase/phosphodiesterase, partial [bacterium]